MIVVAIIGILAAIAIPAYQDYTVRAQVTEGLSLAAAVKAGVAEAYANTGTWPADLTAAGGTNATPPSGKYVASVTVATGVITITYGGTPANTAIKGANKTLTLFPGVSTNTDIVWACSNGAIPAAGITWATAPSAIGTEVLPKYRPKSCRP